MSSALDRSPDSKSGGDGPKLNDLLQARERHLLQDRIELLGSVRHRDVRNVSCPTSPSPLPLPFPDVNPSPGPRPRFHLPQHVPHRVFWHRHPRSRLYRPLRRLHPRRRRPRDPPRRHDLLCKPRRRRCVLLVFAFTFPPFPPLAFLLSSRIANANPR